MTLALVLVVRPGRAEVPAYKAPPECPDDAAFRADVAAHLHEVARGSGGHVQVLIVRQASTYEGVLVAIDDAGHVGRRTLRGVTCSGVAGALAFLAALAIELGGRIEPEAPVVAPRPAPAVASPSRTVTVTAASVAPSARAASRALEFGALALESVRGALAPTPTATAEAGLEAALASGLRASARIVAFVGNTRLADATGSANVWIAGGRLEACPVRVGGALAVRPCLGAELAAVDAQGQIRANPRGKTLPWIAGEALLRTEWLLSPKYFVEAGAAAVVPLARTRYFFEPNDTLYTVPDVAFRAAFGFGLRF
jgi:hypothetical protein